MVKEKNIEQNSWTPAFTDHLLCKLIASRLEEIQIQKYWVLMLLILRSLLKCKLKFSEMPGEFGCLCSLKDFSVQNLGIVLKNRNHCRGHTVGFFCCWNTIHSLPMTTLFLRSSQSFAKKEATCFCLARTNYCWNSASGMNLFPERGRIFMNWDPINLG